MKNNLWKIVHTLGIIILAIGFIMSLVIHFQHWDELITYKQKFMYQLPAICVIVPGWLIMFLGIIKK